MKADVPELPDRVPAKRRALEQAADVHIAMWLAGDTITPSERRRLETEKERRKRLVPDRPVGLLIARQGVTPVQQEHVMRAVAAAQPTEIHHPGVAGPLHTACKRLGVPVTPVREIRTHHLAMPPFQAHGSDSDALREVVTRSTHLVVAAPTNHTPTKDNDVWDAARYARHRNIAVQIILPNGKNIGLDGTEGP